MPEEGFQIDAYLTNEIKVNQISANQRASINLKAPLEATEASVSEFT